MAHKCRKCGTELNDENWYASQRKAGKCICKECNNERTRLWVKANLESGDQNVMGHKCRKCGIELNDDNCYASQWKAGNYICKECDNERNRLWREANPEKAQATYRRYTYKKGSRPLDENKECTLFLGIHVAERVLSHVFKDVEVMPRNNPGYDFVCNKGMKIDVKSSCLMKDKRWLFHTNHNTIADYFLCLAFDNREDLNPLYIWLLPAGDFKHLTGAGISYATVHKWDAYRLDISKIYECCDTIRGDRDG